MENHSVYMVLNSSETGQHFLGRWGWWGWGGGVKSLCLEGFEPREKELSPAGECWHRVAGIRASCRSIVV